MPGLRTIQTAYMPDSSIQIWWPVLANCHKYCLASNRVAESSPYLPNRQLYLDIDLAHQSLVRNLQKKKRAPASPNSKIPTGAEFHRSDVMWKPRYDKYRITAIGFCNIGGPRNRRYSSACDDITWPIMKMPIAHMKNAIVGSAKT